MSAPASAGAVRLVAKSLRHHGATRLRVAEGISAASAPSPCSSSTSRYIANAGLTAGSSLSAFGTEPLEITLRVAMACGTLSLPSQKRWAVSVDWISCG